MEKYGVSDRHGLQKQELEQVSARLKELQSSHEKTASDTQEMARLEIRASELRIELQGS